MPRALFFVAPIPESIKVTGSDILSHDDRERSTEIYMHLWRITPEEYRRTREELWMIAVRTAPAIIPRDRV